MSEKSLFWLRRSIQGFVLVVLLASPFLQLVRTFRQDPYPYPQSPVVQNELIRQGLQQSDHFLRDRMDSFYENVSGGPYSLRFFPIHFSEPLTAATYAVNNILNPHAWNWTFVVTLVIALGIALLMGRVFCGYVCPMSLIVSLNLKVRRKLGLKLPRYSGSLQRRTSKTQRIIIFGSLLLVLMNPVLLQYVLPPAVMQHAWSDHILFGGLSLWFVILFLLLTLELFKPAFFCRRLCPTGSFLSLAGQKKLLHLHLDQNVNCDKGCKKCLDVCWLGLNPKTKVEDSACDLCSRCAHVCPTARIKFLSVVLLTSLTLSQPAIAGEWDEKESYLLDVVERTFDESEFEVQKSDGDPLKVFYSVYGVSEAGRKGGELSLFIHMQNGKEIFAGPIEIRNRDIVSQTLLKTVDFPISIRQRSVYSLQFNFTPNKKYLFEISSPNKEFKKFKISFRYPKMRF